jgi:hypothetical protein
MDRVTRLRELSPIGRMLILSRFFENFTSFPIFSKEKLCMFIFEKKVLGFHIGRFFSQTNLVTLLMDILEKMSFFSGKTK